MLHLVSTPIGNLEDISLRAIRVLKEADVIVAEDTRHTGLLLKHFEIPHKPMISLYDEIETQKLDDLMSLVELQKVALVSDAGTPLISDPGYKLVREAIKRGIKVESIPGPTAAIVALTLSGLPPDKFLFLGFPPEKDSHQKELIEKIKAMPIKCTKIFYVSPYKLKKFLANLDPELDIVICRELTKIYEQVWRGKVSEAKSIFREVKGELVVLF